MQCSAILYNIVRCIVCSGELSSSHLMLCLPSNPSCSVQLAGGRADDGEIEDEDEDDDDDREADETLASPPGEQCCARPIPYRVLKWKIRCL